MVWMVFFPLKLSMCAPKYSKNYAKNVLKFFKNGGLRSILRKIIFLKVTSKTGKKSSEFCKNSFFGHKLNNFTIIKNGQNSVELHLFIPISIYFEDVFFGPIQLQVIFSIYCS